MAIQRTTKPLLRKICPVCGESFETKREEQIYDDLKCLAAARVAKQRAERLARCGGVLRYLESGVWYIEVDGRRVAEHRHVFEQAYGVKLKPNHHIEWINGDKTDNRIENLRLRNKQLDAYVRRYRRLPTKSQLRDPETGFPMCLEHKCPKDVEYKMVSGATGHKCRRCEAARQRRRRARIKGQDSSGLLAA